MNRNMAILFSNATVLPMTAVGNAPRTFAGWVGVDGNRIALVTESETAAAGFRAAHPGLREFDCRGKLVMPGLVNTHCHAAMALQRSLADDIALMEWLHDYIWPFEARQTADDVALGMTLGVVEMLLGGVTSFVDMYYFENRCVETVERLGIRAMLGCNYFDSNVDEVMPQVEEAVRLAAGCDRVQIALAPHSPYTVSPENLLRGKRLADKYGLHLMTHISETQDEVRIVREKYGKTSVEHLDGLGLLGPKTIGAHCIHVTDSDIETLAARGVAVSHNPQSNMKISSGVAPVERMRAAGALVTVGTDGTCSNNDLDMFEEVRTAAFRDSRGLLHLEAEGPGCAALARPERLSELSALLGVPLRLERRGEGSLSLIQQEPLMAVAGVAAQRKGGETVSGDAGTYFKRPDGMLYVLLCDGMGSGPEANRESTLAVRLLEQFLQAGVPARQALSTLASALALRGEDAGGFTTVDLLQIDLFTGDGELYKLGAAPTYVKRSGAVQRLSGSALPAGLSAGEEPVSDRFPLRLSPGDTVLMVSDGICGTGDDRWLREKLEAFDGASPKDLARELITQSPQGATDDRTALVIRVEKRRVFDN